MPSFVTFWPVLPRVTFGSGSLAPAGAASSALADASAAPEAAAVLRNRRRLPPQVPSIVSPLREKDQEERSVTPARRPRTGVKLPYSGRAGVGGSTTGLINC